MIKIKDIWGKLKKNIFFINLVFLFWFLIRTGKKPSRIVYPCQKAALANFGIFLGLSPFMYLHKIKHFFKHNGYKIKHFFSHKEQSLQ